MNYQLYFVLIGVKETKIVNSNLLKMEKLKRPELVSIYSSYINSYKKWYENFGRIASKKM